MKTFYATLDIGFDAKDIEEAYEIMADCVRRLKDRNAPMPWIVKPEISHIEEN